MKLISPGKKSLLNVQLIVQKNQRRKGSNLFYAKCPLGKDKIIALFRKGATIMGIEKPEDFMPHTLRHMLATHLANGPSISVKQGCATMRHKSVAANVNYKKNNTE